MNKGNERRIYLLSLLVSIVTALLLGAGIMALTGNNPLDGYGALVSGALGSRVGIGNTLYKAAQLCITGLATAVASQGGIFNVGGEGQMYLGALASAWLAVVLADFSPWAAIPLCLLIAMAAGAVYALIPALMKVRLGINEVITTILMNTIAIKFCTYMATGPLKTTERGISQGTRAISKAFRFDSLIPGSNLTETVFFVAAASLLVWYLMQRTSVGYGMKLTGQNSRFARFSGLPADKLAVGGMLISGAMCGLLGMMEIFGLQKRFKTDFSNEFYFDGMLVAMIMRYRPMGIVLMSFFFAVLKIGAITMQSRTGISSELIQLVESVIIFFVAAEEGVLQRFRARRAAKALSLSAVGKEGNA